MIITSRYDFSLALQGRDLVMERLDKVWLTSFQETEQRKKARELKNIFNHRDNMLMAQVVQASHGNPGLMEWLDLLVGQMAVAEEPELLEAVNGKLEDFIREHLLRELLQHGGHQLLHFLRWFSIYRRPVSDEGAGQMAEKAGLERWRELLQKGMGLSLIEYDQTHFSYRVTPLLREELLNSMAEHQAGHEAASAYYQKACDTPEQPDPSLVEELVFHSVGFGQKEARSIDMQKIPPSESPIDSKGKIMKVFISYSHGDKKFVNRLTRDLENAGVHVWVDEKKIKVGDSISRKIEEGISECDFFCLVISRHSINSKWVDREYRTALNGQLSPGTTPKILPLLIQNVELPKFLADTLYTDFSRGYAKALKKLFDAVKEE